VSYLDVISLQNAKVHLGVDDTSRDTEIQRMIKSSLAYLERRTNYILYDRDREYHYNNGCVRVYDFPINSTTDTTHAKKVKTLYTVYNENDTNIESITLNVGYANAIDIPDDILDTGYAILECLFEGGKTSELSETIEDMINHLKRFVI